MSIKNIKTSFVAGELAIELTGRMDIDIHTKGAERLQNLYVDPRGGVKAREGLKYISNIPGDSEGRLIPFTSYSTNDKVENLISGITMIPGSGEFVYDTVIQEKIEGTFFLDVFRETSKSYINYHNSEGKSNALVSLDKLQQNIPNLKYISLTCNWFGDNIDANLCNVYPAVEYHSEFPNETAPNLWSVAGQSRQSAREIGRDIDGNIRFGGTPTDQSILRFIDDINRRGIKVCFYPILMMDIDMKPWRGRLTGNANDISNFFTKPNGYNQYILHYANLVKGKVSAFIIGSEMIGLTKVRATDGSYPAVDRLCDLALQVKAILGSSVKITYAADWSEYHHTSGGYYNLDKLWANPNIDVIGIDAYFPITNSLESTYDLQVLQDGWTSGEGWDYYYSDSINKTNPIMFADSKYAWKNIKYWYQNNHYDPDGVQTPWVPISKPIWFTEYGFPSIDCASNQPNMFYDPRVLDSGIPTHSNGRVDNMAQYMAVLATEEKWKGSDIVQQKMLWTWDARPYPIYPLRNDIWSDSISWSYGHWVSGKFTTKGQLKERDAKDTYLLVFFRGGCDIFKDDVKVSRIISQPILDLSIKHIHEMKVAQSSDTLIITHEDLRPIRIFRRSHTNWQAEYLPLENIPVYAFSTVAITTPLVSLTLSAVVGDLVSVTSSTDIFLNTQINQLIVAKRGGIFRILNFINATTVSGVVETEFVSATINSGDWELETGYEVVWSDTRGYPKTCCFFQDRLWFGGSKSQPDVLWASVLSDYFNFNIGSAKDDQAISRVISDNSIVNIRNLFAGRHLQIFTSGSEWYLVQDSTQPITPANASIIKSTMHGNSWVTPISVDGATIFVDNSGTSIREFLFNQLEVSYNAKNISILSSHLINQPIDMAIRESTDDNPACYVFFVNSDGTIAVLNTLREQNLLAWSSFKTEGHFENVCVMQKETYMIIRRIVDKIERRFIEKLDKTSFLDCSIRNINYEGSIEHNNFELFENQEVNIRADNFVENPKVVSNGKILFDNNYKDVEIGYSFSKYIKTLPVVADIQQSTGRWTNTVGDFTRLIYVQILLNNSGGFKIKNSKTEYSFSPRKIGDKLIDVSENVFSGWTNKIFMNGISRTIAFEITSEEPIEFNILSIIFGVK